jgi:dTDP-glucose 4,6-dehydratase
MRRLLITGGAGFIGSHFVEHCLRSDAVDRVVVLDALTYAGRREYLDGVREEPRFRFVQGDICDSRLVQELLREERLDCIVNCAAESHVDRSIAAAAVFLRSNVLGVHSLLEAARNVWLTGPVPVLHRFHQVSTDEVFGTMSEGVTARDESAPYAPRSPYAASKAAADHLVHAWRDTHGMRVSISYSSNVYGPRQHEEKFIPVIIRSLAKGEQVPVYGDGQQRRSWLHVEDLCRALERFLAPDMEGRSLYVGADGETTNVELVHKLCAIVSRDREKLIRFVADRPGHDRRYGLRAGQFAALTGFAPRVELDRGLAGTIDWYEQQQQQQRR